MRRLKQNLGHQRSSNHDRAGQKHDEYGRAVAGIGKAVIEPADLAARPQRQEARKQLTLAAARTAAGQARRYGAGKRGDRVLALNDDLVSRAQRSTKRASEVVRCRSGSFQTMSIWRSRNCGAPLRAAPRPGNLKIQARQPACGPPPQT